ncbi:ABC transporter ATP-binding protein [Fusibacter sp. JL216-2]|uniref:ABC transporter ATP-binding protein n=1 Tax=Fusibacter sp. JL216-2 TaxID=3071453 RepID=UPI003D35595B
MLEVKGLYHSYSNDNNYAIENMNFEVKEGEIFGFLGPSGAGKSTTQSVLFGLLELQKGDVSIDGRSISKLDNSFFNLIGVCFEYGNVYRNLTGLENLRFYSTMFGVQTQDPMKLLRMVGLEKAADKKASKYSKGMLQRLVFARSMLNNPKIWFLDEPTSGLDPETASRIKTIIKEKRDQGTTIFLTTHNMNIADELCDRVAFINEGKIILVDTPENLKLRYGSDSLAVTYKSDKGEKSQNEILSMKDKDDKEKLHEIIRRDNLVKIHSQEASLEEVFIQLTGRELV